MAYKMKGFGGFGNSPLTQKTKVDPDAPGTPGKPGYEPPVKPADKIPMEQWYKEEEEETKKINK